MLPKDKVILALMSSNKTSHTTDSTRFNGNMAKALNMIKASIEGDAKCKRK